jgi:microcystin-dependent protein
MSDPLTPNAGLDLVPPSMPNWANKMNDNLILIDAIIGSYFAVNQLKGLWTNSTAYIVNDSVVDKATGIVWKCLVANTSSAFPTTFATSRTTNPSYWGGYTSPARSRGPWIPATSYTVNDFVVSGSQYAICVQNNVSTGSFTNDVNSGYWSILIDLSTVGQSILPVPGGPADAQKFAVVTTNGLGYTIIAATQALQALGGTSVGLSVFQAVSQGAALAAIGAQVAGNYQPLSAALTALSAATTGAYGLTVLGFDTEAQLAASLGLMTAAFQNVGAGANNVVQLDGTAKLPAVDASQLLNLPAGSGPTTGDLKPTHKTAADAGWILWSDGTIGSATSGATIRANADTAALYALYWSYSDALCPVSGGRGANAAADFSANKTIGVLKGAGRVLGLAGSGSGLTARTVGALVGEETHVLTSAEQASMTGAANVATTGVTNPGAGINDPAVTNQGLANFAVLGGVPNATFVSAPNIQSQVTGGGGAHNNMQPTGFYNIMIKL